jgi:hypothetical protein
MKNSLHKLVGIPISSILSEINKHLIRKHALLSSTAKQNSLRKLYIHCFMHFAYSGKNIGRFFFHIKSKHTLQYAATMKHVACLKMLHLTAITFMYLIHTHSHFNEV